MQRDASLIMNTWRLCSCNEVSNELKSRHLTVERALVLLGRRWPNKSLFYTLSLLSRKRVFRGYQWMGFGAKSAFFLVKPEIICPVRHQKHHCNVWTNLSLCQARVSLHISCKVGQGDFDKKWRAGSAVHSFGQKKMCRGRLKWMDGICMYVLLLQEMVP